MKDSWWWMASPFIDAYQHAEWVSASKGGGSGKALGIDQDEFFKRMRSQAMNWGAEGLGTAIARGKEIPRTETGKLVFAMGIWDERYWVTTGYPGLKWWEEGQDFEIEEFVWPDEWNVT